jgi:uncharacterized SAM-binding protein YcdF (DUF218 family)
MPFWTLRRRLAAAAVVLLLAALGYGAVVLAVALNASRDQAGTADAIVVLGAAQYNGRPSPVFRSRLDHAAALYYRGLAPTVVVTGGVGRGDSLSETEVGRQYLLSRGLPPAAVVALPPAPSTYGGLKALARWFGGRQHPRALFVSDGFHMLRLRILAPRAGIAPLTSATPTSPIRANLRLNLGYVLAEGYKVPFAWLFQH